jgi:hypothetical protein
MVTGVISFLIKLIALNGLKENKILIVWFYMLLQTGKILRDWTRECQPGGRLS